MYKFLTRPWDDGRLRESLLEACRYYGLSRENERLAEEATRVNRVLADHQVEIREVVASD